jgi:hypothetical protein
LFSSGAACTGLGAACVYSLGAQAKYEALPEDGLPLTYEPAEINRFWAEHPAIALRRLGVIATSVLPFAIGTLGDWLTTSADARERVQVARARALRELLTELGPTFIKCPPP